LNDPQSALIYLNAARVLAPDDPQISYEWADALALNGKLAEALSVFERLLLMEPINPKVHLAVMKASWVLKQMDRAQTAYQWLVGQAPEFLRAAQQQDPLVRQITQ
jgi:tetratricopeptide (TPR) repeat protein